MEYEATAKKRQMTVRPWWRGLSDAQSSLKEAVKGSPPGAETGAVVAAAVLGY